MSESDLPATGRREGAGGGPGWRAKDVGHASPAAGVGSVVVLLTGVGQLGDDGHDSCGVVAALASCGAAPSLGVSGCLVEVGCQGAGDHGIWVLVRGLQPNQLFGVKGAGATRPPPTLSIAKSQGSSQLTV